MGAYYYRVVRYIGLLFGHTTLGKVTDTYC